MDIRLTLLTLTMLAPTVHAQLAPSAGLSGEIALNAGYTTSKSQFNTDSARTLTSLEQAPDRESSLLVAPLGNLAYTFGSRLNQQIYLGTTRSDIAVGTLAFQLGYRYQLPSSVIVDISYLPTVIDGETWRNPYLLNTARQTTDEGGNAFRLQLNRLVDGNLNLDFAYADKDVEHDQVSDLTLLRDAQIYYVKSGYRIPLSRTSSLKPAITYISQDAAGEAESFDSYGIDISWFSLLNRHRLALTTEYQQRDYQAASQTFSTTRKDDNWRFFVAYEYQNVFNWQDWSFVSFASYSQTESNIRFYDETQSLVSVGLNYRF
ncbi:DUF2860 domain-containing protein [Vibrio sp. CAU 1672]|uniref:DUF2860 domain-containing protein n=1 Tax=Vibrio sp. CAU 1672 TaxID=3032594 RepID=UPI0023DCA376|nr:DUF2860 domain-containing protein [Vibrio sp. CAU 1672]MDF2155090.1 DUF2860 domain-containing protein [Vibrio sp. CAU 1672]